MTIRDLIRSSLRLLNVLSAGENPTAEELQDAIGALRLMLDSWATDGFIVPARKREEFPLTQGKASYTIGPLGDFDTDRPVEFERATLLDETGGTPIETPVDLINTDEWAAITSKTLQSTPNKLYSTGESPLNNLFLYPVPDSSKKLVLYSRGLILSITNANTQISLPPGYERALKYNLAVELAPEYGKSVPVEVGTIAIESKANVMRLNGKANYLEATAALVGGRFFNIYTGES